jgi:hypothetical protein
MCFSQNIFSLKHIFFVSYVFPLWDTISRKGFWQHISERQLRIANISTWTHISQRHENLQHFNMKEWRKFHGRTQAKLLKLRTLWAQLFPFTSKTLAYHLATIFKNGFLFFKTENTSKIVSKKVFDVGPTKNNFHFLLSKILFKTQKVLVDYFLKNMFPNLSES